MLAIAINKPRGPMKIFPDLLRNEYWLCLGPRIRKSAHHFKYWLEQDQVLSWTWELDGTPHSWMSNLVVVLGYFYEIF